MSITLPDPKKQTWKGIFPGDFSGDFIRAFNIDLEKSPGRLLLADRTKILTDSGDVASLGVPIAFSSIAPDGTAIWGCLSSDRVLVTSGLGSTTFAADTRMNSPVSTSNHGLIDWVEFVDNANLTHLIVCGSTDSIVDELTEYNSSSGNWTDKWQPDATKSTFFARDFKSLAVLSNILLVGAANKIDTVDGNLNVTIARLTMDRNFENAAIYVSKDRAWIMGQSLNSQANGIADQGLIYEWDGGNETVNNSYAVSSLPLSGFIANDLPYFVLRDGRIVGFTNSAFKPVAFFPNFEENLPFASNAVTIKGCAVNGNNVLINIEAPLGSKRMKSGTWLFNVKTLNLYPIYAIGQYKGSGNIDFGQSIISSAGGILYHPDRDLFFFGGTIYTQYSGSTKNAICTVSRNDTNGNRGYFITPILPSSNVEEYWYNLWLRFPRLLSNLNKIVGKYRVTDGLYNSSYQPIQLTITWVDTTHFTATLPTGIVNGNEVEILAGDNAGCLVHILNMSAVPDGVTTITVTIDEAVPQSSTHTSLAELNDWVKITKNNPITSQTLRTQFLTLGSGGSPGANTASSGGPYVQFKIELRGILTGIDQYSVDSKPQTEKNL